MSLSMTRVCGERTAVAFALTFITALCLNFYVLSRWSDPNRLVYLSESSVETASVTELWMRQAAKIFIAGTHSRVAGSSRDRHSLTELKMEPFDINGKINAWDVYPPDVSCPDITRLGNLGDGGKFVCGLSWLRERRGERQCVVYSFGISTDNSFEVELQRETGCAVYGFDPTVGGVNNEVNDGGQQGSIVFHKSALSTNSGSSADFSVMEHLLDTMHRLNHSYIDILKADVEGAEWNVFRDLMRSDFLARNQLRFGQLLIELHFKTSLELDSFFRSMHDADFVSFSREVNLIPCLKGQLPLAAEYSLINPAMFFSPAAQPKERPRPKDPTWHTSINAVIYILTHKERVHLISETLRLIYDNVWKQFPNYPVIIFHDDLEEKHRSTIQRAVVDMPLKFIKIKFELPPLPNVLPNSTDKREATTDGKWSLKDVPKRTVCSALSSTVGYRHMIRFHATQVHTILNKLHWKNGGKLEYIWRLDDDSYITHPIGYDVFRFMKTNKLLYGFVNMVKDDPLCVKGLWAHASDFYNSTLSPDLSGNALNGSFFNELEEGLVFYNNFEVSSATLWADSRWKRYMDAVDSTGNIYLERWGDAPLHTVGVAMIAPKRSVHKFSDIGYRHDPFVYQSPQGLPRPHMDPLRGDDAICVFYEQWICTPSHLLNGTNHSRVYANMGIPLPEWAVFSKHTSHQSIPSFQAFRQSNISHPSDITENSIVEGAANDSSTSFKSVRLEGAPKMEHEGIKGAIYTFVDVGGEELVVETLSSFYDNYAKRRDAPFVLFHESDVSRRRRGEDSSFRTSILTRHLSREAMRLVTIIPVDLVYLNRSMECPPGSDSPLTVWICSTHNHSTGRAPQSLRGNLPEDNYFPSSSCIDGLSTSAITLMKISSFLSFRVTNILITMGYDWMWRIGLSSRLNSPISYDIFEHLASTGKRYAFHNVVRERQECVDSIWDLALALCKAREKTDCRGLVHRWPSSVVVFTNFELSHRTTWETAIFIDFLKRIIEVQGEMDLKLQPISEFTTSDPAKPVWLWKDAAVHTLGMLLSLSLHEVSMLTAVQYKLVDMTMKTKAADIAAETIASSKGSHRFGFLHEDLPRLSNMFHPRRFGWLGADVAASFLLPSVEFIINLICSAKGESNRCDPSPGNRLEKYIWLFGDTLVGTSSQSRRLEGVIVPNSAGLAIVDTSLKSPNERLTKISFYWGSGGDGIPEAIFLPSDESRRDTFAVEKEDVAKHRPSISIISVNDSFSGAEIKFWPLSGIAVVDVVGASVETLQSTGPRLDMTKFCQAIVLGHFVTSDPKKSTGDGAASDVSLLLGSTENDFLDFRVLNSAIAIVENPYLPPDLWVYKWKVIPPVVVVPGVSDLLVSYDWFSLTAATGEDVVMTSSYVYILGVYSSRRVPKASRNVSSLAGMSVSHDFFSIAVNRYNVIGRARVSDILASKPQVIEILYPSDNSNTNQKGVWRSSSQMHSSPPMKCFPFDGVSTEATLDFDEVASQWIFVSLMLLENALKICKLKVPLGLRHLISSCNWSCETVSALGPEWTDNPSLVTYAARLHKELAHRTENEIMEMVISYVPNTIGGPKKLFLDDHINVYTPKFLSLRPISDLT